MFPSCGLFADITCPFSARGICKRPHCFYKHDLVARVESTSSSFSVDVDPEDGSLQELQRINKEIEAVRHEVELEQRRLSHYQTSQGEGRNTPPVFSLYKFEGVCKKEDRPSDVMAAHSNLKKYVVDNSKPSTDLEYDPLSNFSAGLRFCGSSSKQRISKGALERENITLCHQKVSPGLFDEPTEDRVLIIDIPQSPDRKRSKYEKQDDYTADILKSENQLKESKRRLVPNCPQQATNGMHKDTFHFEQGEENPDINCAVEKTSKGFESTPTPVDSSVTGLTKSQPAGFKHINDKKKTFERILTQSHPSVFEEKAKPVLPSSSDVSPSDDISPASLPSKQLDIQTNSTEMEVNGGMSSEIRMQPLMPCSQKTASKNPALLDVAFNDQTSLVINERNQTPSDASESQNSVDNLANVAVPPESNHLPSKKENVIIISSSEEEELNYSDLSDSDPMEECYRIFMEANESVKEPEKESDVSLKEELPVPSSDPPRKKWVAHEAKHTELPVQSRPEPQILVPLGEPAASRCGSQSSSMTRIHLLQQRASTLTTSVKGGQAFVSLTPQRKPETQTNAVHATQIAANAQPVSVLNACTNYLPLGTAVIDVGNNLQLILPEGTFPLPVSCANSPVTSVLTPVGQSNSVGVKQICLRAAVTPVQRHHTRAPVLIPAQSLRPSPPAVAAHLHPTASATSQFALQSVNVKPPPTKRKSKQCEPAKDKVPHDVRQRYVNMFTEEFLKTTPNVNDAFEKAVAEEKTVYNRSANQLKYLSVAVNSLKRLKNQTTASSSAEKAPSEKRKGKISLNLEMCRQKSDTAFFQSLSDYIVPEEMLIENNFPVQHPEKPGSAVLFQDNNKASTDPLKRTCCRCGATYSVSKSGKHVRKEECNYHYGRGVEKRVPGGVETRYSCCQGVMGAPGCQVFQLHVHDSLSLDGFVSTKARQSSDTHCPGVYSLDCAMSYTVSGLELSRVSVVNSCLQVIYDKFIRPASEVIDYNTRFTGISEEDVKGNNTSLTEVQETLMSFINADTILIGHGLQTALCALKLLHDRVVDTSVVFPHRLGPPHKRTLNQLTSEYLRRIIQESVCGHDTADDAAACMELMLWKAKEDGKLKK